MDDSRFRDHAVWQQLGTLDVRLAETESWADQSDPNLVAIRWLASALHSHQDPADSLPYPLSILDGLNNNLAGINTALTDANTSEHIANLGTVGSQIDSATQQVGVLPPVTNRDPARQASRTFLEYRESVEGALTRLNSRASEIKRLLQQHAKEAKEQGTDADQRLTALKASVDQLQAKIAQDETRLDAALTNTNDSFNQAQTARDGTFSDWLEQRSSEFETGLDDIKSRSQQRLTEIEELHAAVEKVSGKAAAAILAKDYGTYSTREWWSGVVAYVLGFATLLGLGIYLIQTVSNVSKDEQVSWQYVALKLGLTATAIAVATVAFQFGGHALSRANSNKRVQLELGTIGSFLADVDDEAAVQKAKLDFVDRMFGRAWDQKPSPVTDGTVNVSAFGKLVDVLLKAQSGK